MGHGGVPRYVATDVDRVQQLLLRLVQLGDGHVKVRYRQRAVVRGV